MNIPYFDLAAVLLGDDPPNIAQKGDEEVVVLRIDGTSIQNGHTTTLKDLTRSFVDGPLIVNRLTSLNGTKAMHCATFKRVVSRSQIAHFGDQVAIWGE